MRGRSRDADAGPTGSQSGHLRPGADRASAVNQVKHEHHQHTSIEELNAREAQKVHFPDTHAIIRPSDHSAFPLVFYSCQNIAAPVSPRPYGSLIFCKSME